MPVTHEPWLVALSIVVAIQGAYVGLSLAVQVAEAAGVRRRLLLAGSALSLGVAIWSMHFVGMLAVRLPFPDRLSGAADAALVPRLRDRGRRGDLRRERRTADAASSRRRGDLHGARHRLHALSRHERAPRERPHDACAGLRRGERRQSPSPPPASRSSSPADGAAGRRSSSPRRRSASRFPGCTTRRWPASPSCRMPRR